MSSEQPPTHELIARFASESCSVLLIGQHELEPVRQFGERLGREMRERVDRRVMDILESD